jgi:hypothetical protein
VESRNKPRGSGNIVALLDAQSIFQNGVLTASPSSSYPDPYFVNFYFNDTFCITNNFTLQVRLKNDSATGGAPSGDTWLNIKGSGIVAGCLLEGNPAAQAYTSIYVGTSGMTNLPQLVMDLSDWRIIQLDFKDNVVYYSYDSTNFFSLPYTGNICNINQLNLGFREAGQVDYVKIFDANNSLIYYEEFDDCNSIATAPECLPPDVSATTANAAYCEGDSVQLFGNSNVPIQYNWIGPNGFSSSLQNPILYNAGSNYSGWYMLTGYVNPCTPSSVDSVYVTINPAKATFLYPSICQGDSLIAGGASQTVAGTYFDTLATSLGCDSIIVTNLTILPASATSLLVSICQGDSFFVAGNFQSISGIYFDTLQNAVGCDSVITTTLAVLPTVYYSQNLYICEGDSIFLSGMFQKAAGVYNDTLNSAAGCDSVIISTLDVIAPVYTNLNISICFGQTYFAGGAYQSTPGTYYDTLNTILGCDSVLITQLNVIMPVYGSQTIFICEGDSFLTGGAYQNTAGIYVDTIQSSVGCDSVLTTDLQIIPIVYASVTASICLGDSLFVGGGYQIQAGTFYDTLKTNAGCDSVITTALTVYSPVYTNQSISICEGDSYFAGGAFQTTAGTYIDTLQSSVGCDSVQTTVLQVIFPVYTNQSVTICDGQTYFAGGALQTLPGVYYDSLQSNSGCDSILVTDLSVLPNPIVYLGQDTSICEGTSLLLDAGAGFSNYTWSDNSQSSSVTADLAGTYWVTVTDQNGCAASDTLVIAEVFKNPSGFLPADSTVCGKFSRYIDVPGYVTYSWNTGSDSAFITITQPGDYSLQVTDVNGCVGSDEVVFDASCDDPVVMPNALLQMVME